MASRDQPWTLSLPDLQAASGPEVEDDKIPPPIDISGRPPEQLKAGPPADTLLANRYRIAEKIGEGGMGKVYRVVHLRLKKSFALKLMHSEISQKSSLRKQFYKEARLASSLAHPNIVSVVDFGEDPAWGAFMVMEFLHGELLTTRFRRHGRVPVKVTCDIAMQLADALHYIHEQNIMHGDVKPDNVMCAQRPSSDRRKWSVKLLDFGLAQIRDTQGGRAATVAGTPEYMAPERFKGEASTPRSDIYSLGVVMYEMLAGRPPFVGNVDELRRGHVLVAPAPLAVVRDEPIDERLEEIVMRALAKEPALRQRNMAAFLYQLRTCVEMLGFKRRRHQSNVKSAQESRQEQQQVAKAFGFDALPLPVASLSARGIVTVANRAFSAFLSGLPDRDVIGVNLLASDLVKLYPKIMADLRRVHMGGAPVKNDLRVLDAEGKRSTLQFWLWPVEDEAGSVLLMVQAAD